MANQSSVPGVLRKIRKQPFRFSLHHDIRLLKMIFSSEPWKCNGRTGWMEISSSFNAECSADTMDRTVKEHFRRLLEDYRNDDLIRSSKSGTEEVHGEREILLEDIRVACEAYVDEAREDGRLCIKFKRYTKKKLTEVNLISADYSFNAPLSQNQEIIDHDTFDAGAMNKELNDCSDNENSIEIMSPSDHAQNDEELLDLDIDLTVSCPSTSSITKKRGRPKVKATIEKEEADSSREKASEIALNEKNSLADEPTHSRNYRAIRASELAKDMIVQKNKNWL